jgi:hypothetical protein
MANLGLSIFALGFLERLLRSLLIFVGLGRAAECLIRATLADVELSTDFLGLTGKLGADMVDCDLADAASLVLRLVVYLTSLESSIRVWSATWAALLDTTLAPLLVCLADCRRVAKGWICLVGS